MKLVVVESPSKAKTIQKYLGSGYRVLASYGHIFEIPSKPDSIDIEKDFLVKYETKKTPNTKAILEEAKKADTVFFASDPDREGEAISWEVCEYLKKNKINKENYRITFSEITETAVKDAIKNARKIDDNLVDAQKSRAVLDFLVGFKISPVLWKKLKNAKSAGRVQSAALRLIAERELEISAFKPKEYWSINLDIKDDKNAAIQAATTSFNDKKFNSDYPNSKEEASLIEKFILDNKNNCILDDNKKSILTRKPKPPFTTSTLQQEALNKFGFGAKQTMQIAQKLYEGIEIKGKTTGLITYMRTDGINLAQDAISSIRSFLQKAYSNDYIPSKPIAYKSKIKNAQEAHEAIRPTNVENTPSSIESFLSTQEFKLYSLIWARTVACQMMDAKFEQHSLTFKIENKDILLAKTTASKMVFDGYLKVYNDYQEVSDKSITFNENSLQNTVEKVLPKQHFTTPPARYNEGSLIKTLEEKGIGRPSTFASILSTLLDRQYVEMEKKSVKPTQTGIITATFLKNFFSKYVDYDFTAKLEEELDDIASGKLDRLGFLSVFWKNLKVILNDAEQGDQKTVFSTLTQELQDFLKSVLKCEHLNCDKCQTGQMQINSGKYGYFLSCNQYPNCKNIMSFGSDAKTTQDTTSMDNQTPIVEEEGLKIFVKVGKYGKYLEVHKGEVKKNVSVPNNIDLSPEMAKFMSGLPKNIGQIEGDDVVVNIGRFGPYVLFNKTFYSVKNVALNDIDIEMAKQIIESQKNKKPSTPKKTSAVKKSTTKKASTKKATNAKT